MGLAPKFISKYQVPFLSPIPQTTVNEFPTHLAVVNTDNATNHFGNDDHVAEVCLDDSRFFIGGSLLLSLTELLDETHGTTFETALEPAAGTGVDELYENSLEYWNLDQ